jgi:matrixin
VPHRTFAPLVVALAVRADVRSQLALRAAKFIPAALTTLAFIVAACVSSSRTVPLPPESVDDAAAPRAYRWPIGTHELRVWIEPWSPLRGWTPAHVATVDSALDAWSSAGTMSFVHVTRSDDADIRLRWTDDLPASHPGVTKLTPNEHGELRVANILVNVTPGPSRGARSRLLYGIVAHEIGHAVGLPHAESRSRLMYPVLYELSVTPEDLDALRRVATQHQRLSDLGSRAAAGRGQRLLGVAAP